MGNERILEKCLSSFPTDWRSVEIAIREEYAMFRGIFAHTKAIDRSIEKEDYVIDDDELRAMTAAIQLADARHTLNFERLRCRIEAYLTSSRVSDDKLHELKQQAERDITPDGPIPPKSFWWNGKSVSLTPTGWRLVTFLWQSRHHTAGVDAAVDAAWNNKEATQSAVDSLISRTNSEFADREMNVRISQSNGFLTLELDSRDHS